MDVSNRRETIVFLDIDGVMNDDSCDYSCGISKQHLLQLKRIVDETGASIVLSSSWRMSLESLNEVIDALHSEGIPFRGTTLESAAVEFVEKNFPNVKPKSGVHVRYGLEYRKVVDDRGAEIAFWVTTHDVGPFVILDDEVYDIIDYYPHNVVRTSMKTGLTDENVEEAIRILKAYSKYGA